MTKRTQNSVSELLLIKYFLSTIVSVFDQLDLVTYEEVVRLDYFKRKTLVLLGKALNIFKFHL